jgi:hypothetical protein
MINDIIEIINNRNCGDVRISFIKTYPGDNHLKIAQRAGLSGELSTYHEVTNQDGLMIINSVFSKDMAYGSNLHFNESLFTKCFNFSGSEKWYSNAYIDDSSWNPATDSTFDKGVIVIDGSISVVLWVEDED